MDADKYASIFVSYKGFKVYVVDSKKNDPESWKYGDLIYLDDAKIPHFLPREFVDVAKKYAFKAVELTVV